MNLSLPHILKSATERLQRSGSKTAQLDAEILLSTALDCKRSQLFARSDNNLNIEHYRHFESMLQRRCSGEPIAYITGIREFWSLPIRVRPPTLIPRPETETLIECCLQIAKKSGTPNRILDLCTGSGCIAAALAHEFPNAHIVATDISADALELARENLHLHAQHITLLQGDLFGGLNKLTEDQRIFDIIISNPPYVADHDVNTALAESAHLETRSALAAGSDGLDVIRCIVNDAPQYLCAEGWLVIEMGAGQEHAVHSIAHATNAYSMIESHTDLANIPRAICAQKRKY